MKARTRDMTSGNAAKQIFFFALPLMLGNILQQMYTMEDTIVVGRAIGAEALAAIGASVLLLPALIGQYGVYFAEAIAWLGAEILLMVTYYRRMNRLHK